MKVGEVRKVDGYIEIQVTDTFTYDIPIVQMIEDEKSGRLNWIWHLRSKRWFTPTIEHKVVALLNGHGVKLTSQRPRLRILERFDGVEPA